MRSECVAYEDAIWEHAGAGIELSEDALAHINQCAHCAQALKEAKQAMGLVLAADCVPPAPDCRAAVMARITPQVRWPRMVWTYSFAGLALAGVVFAVVITPRLLMAPSTRPSQLAKKSVESQKLASMPTYNGTVKAKAILPDQKIARAESREAETPIAHIRAKLPNHRIASVPRKQVEDKQIVAMSKPVEQPYMMVKVEPSDLSSGDDVTKYDYASDEKLSDNSSLYKDKDNLSTSFVAPSATPAPSLGIKEVVTAAPKTGITLNYDNDGLDMRGDTTDGSGGAFSCKGVIKAKAEGVSDIALGTSVTEGKVFSHRGKEPPAKAYDGYGGVAVGRPMAIAVVSWPSDYAPVDNDYSYSYTDIDEKTGQTTNCKVKRSGDSIEIRIEAEPNSAPLPKKGSVDYASNTAA